ncbi:MAG: sulfatase-like hydrolase/transferase [Vicinamibacterales bacterium]
MIACGPTPSRPATAPASARSVLLITIDTLRADHVGAYGYAAARTPVMDDAAKGGVRFEKAWAAAPITLTSHASLLTGRYPPGHGARHNGIAVNAGVPTLATVLKAAGFATAAFVSAFPLDKRFGLQRGFDVYDDELPRASDGRPLNERPGADTAARAASWLQGRRGERFLLWVHLFDPHAPYGDPSAQNSRPAIQRYDEEIATADREVGRLLSSLGEAAASTLVVIAADHGEAFGEHGEMGHSIFVYDTTLQVPLLMRGPGVPRGVSVKGDVSLVDAAPTIIALLGLPEMDLDGRSLVPVINGRPLDARPIYAESFAPLFDFGWAGLRSVRDGGWKYIAAPKPELYDLSSDREESVNRVGADPQRASRLDTMAGRWPAPNEVEGSGPAPGAAQAASPEVLSRLQSLGYVGGSRRGGASARPDPKDRIALASRLAMVTSGEVQGRALLATLEAILRDDPQNPQAHLRLGYAELERNQCARAEPHFRAAIKSGLPSADAGLGLAQCRGRAGDLAGAADALAAARKAEPESPVVAANIGLLALQQKRIPAAITELGRALQGDPHLHEARFALARALALSGDRAGATAQAQTLLSLLPPAAPERREVERLLAAVK